MQTATAGADQIFWFDNFINARKMLWQRATIRRMQSGNSLEWICIRFIFNVDRRDRCFEIFQCQIELFRIALL